MSANHQDKGYSTIYSTSFFHILVHEKEAGDQGYGKIVLPGKSASLAIIT